MEKLNSTDITDFTKHLQTHNFVCYADASTTIYNSMLNNRQIMIFNSEYKDEFLESLTYMPPSELLLD